MGTKDTKTDIKLGNGISNADIESKTPNDQIHDGFELDTKTKLYQKLNSMKPFNRMVFLKTMQFNVLSEVLDAVNNGKNTPEKVWKNVIRKMNAIKGIKAGKDRSGIDFNKILSALIPLIGTIAGLFIALRQAEKEEQKSAEPDLDPNFPDTINSETAAKICAEDKAKNIQRSIVMQLCELNENGFSFHK